MSSWRDVARKVREGRSSSAEADGYAGEEREAIAAFDGGLPLPWASELAAMERRPRPDGIAQDEWRARLDMIWRRADEHGAELAANGYTFREIFDVGESWRPEQLGAAWFLPDWRIVAIDPERIVFERKRGERLTHIKREGLH